MLCPGLSTASGSGLAGAGRGAHGAGMDRKPGGADGRLLGVLADLVLPLRCAACGGPARGVAACARCLGEVAFCVPGATRPDPPPAGLPPCVAAAAYDGAVRELLLSLKEHGERTLAAPLGRALARAVVAGPTGDGVPAGCRHLVLVPVPTTAAAVRQRGGDHLGWLVRHAARALRRAGWRVTVVRPLRARPKVDSTHLDRAGRARAAREAFALRRGWRSARAPDRSARVVVVDDVITTGATLAAVSALLRAGGVEVSWAAALAATRLRQRPVSIRSLVTQDLGLPLSRPLRSSSSDRFGGRGD